MISVLIFRFVLFCYICSLFITGLDLAVAHSTKTDASPDSVTVQTGEK